MKPEDLKSPFSWEKRQILIKDKVWFVPDYYDKYETFTFPGWSHAEIFGNDHPVNLEYCSGNGSWIAGKAADCPSVNWVGIEMKFGRVRKIWSKIKNLQLPNLFAICGEGHNVTHRYFPDGCISNIFINFPDPWPKNRHAKHRIIQPEFLVELHRILKNDGTITFVTDDADYSEWTIDIFSKNKGFTSCCGAPFYTTEQPEYGTSYFDQLWREKGKTIRYHQYRKQLVS